LPITFRDKSHFAKGLLYGRVGQSRSSSREFVITRVTKRTGKQAKSDALSFHWCDATSANERASVAETQKLITEHTAA